MQEETKKENLSDKILKEINCNKICPTPKWCFVCKNYGFWFVVALSGVIVSLTLSLIIFFFMDQDWGTYQLRGTNILNYILFFTPYFWIIVFLLFILLIIYSFNKTKEGYKIGNVKSVQVGALVIIVIALVCVFAGASSIIDESFHKRVPMYSVIIFDKHSTWGDPQRGLLGGEITSIKDVESFVIRDFKNKNWNVQEEKNIKIIPSNFIIKTGEKIKMIGRLCLPCPEKNTFIVSEIKPWEADFGF